MRAGRYEDALLLGHESAPSEPCRGRFLIGAAAAEALVAQQADEVAGDVGEPLTHADHEIGVGRFRRQVHRQVDDVALLSRTSRAPRRLGAADEGALADARIDEAATLRLDVAAGDCGEVDREPLGQRALRRQPVPARQSPALHVVGDDVGDREIARLGAVGKIGKPVVHEAPFSKISSKNRSTN